MRIVAPPRAPLPGGRDVYVASYDTVRRATAPFEGLAPQALVLDEIQALRDTHSARTRAMLDLADGVRARGGRVLGLSGTPMVNRPIELAGPLLVVGALGPGAPLGDFWSFARRYAQARRRADWWDLTGAAYLDELNARLRATCYLRRTSAEVLPQLPAVGGMTVWA